MKQTLLKIDFAKACLLQMSLCVPYRYFYKVSELSKFITRIQPTLDNSK